MQVSFLSERMVVGVGFDCNPMVFVADESGLWYVEYLELERLAFFTGLYYFFFSFFLGGGAGWGGLGVALVPLLIIV